MLLEFLTVSLFASCKEWITELFINLKYQYASTLQHRPVPLPYINKLKEKGKCPIGA